MHHCAKLFSKMRMAVIFFIAVAGGTAAGPLEDGRAAYAHGDYATALRLLRPLVDQGNAGAQDILGIMYFVGQGVPQDRAEAIKLYRLAAEQRYAHAQDSLGFAYLDGVEVQQDYGQLPCGIARLQIKAISTRSSISERCMNSARVYRRIMSLHTCGLQLAAAPGSALMRQKVETGSQGT